MAPNSWMASLQGQNPDKHRQTDAFYNDPFGSARIR